MGIKLLLLEDDIQLSEIIAEYLEENGCDVTLASDGQEAMDKIYEERFDLLLLDVKVPFMNGFDLLSKIRKDGNETPAIFLTSLNSIDDLSRAFEAGCDDYLKKPFELKELLLRIKTISKRAFFHKADEKIDIGGGVLFDINSSKIIKDGETVTLSKKESLILKLLVKNRGKIVTPQMIFENAWDYEDEPSEMSLRTYIKNIRKIIGKELIQNARGQGYMIAAS
ncbi:MAG: response regulator transcription factor [Campylobacteraceae bacterium]|jgi:OmpR-family two-component system manganese-sensing response regulator|nr:response regulator transcription factor [Campylobacteraceae bacterium]